MEIHPDAAGGIQAHLAELSAQLDLGQIEIRGSGDLAPGSCKINWNDGGAVRDAAAISAKILEDIESLLQGRGSGIPHADDDINMNQGMRDSPGHEQNGDNASQDTDSPATGQTSEKEKP